jgi:hypothetical protein
MTFFFTGISDLNRYCALLSVNLITLWLRSFLPTWYSRLSTSSLVLHPFAPFLPPYYLLHGSLFSIYSYLCFYHCNRSLIWSFTAGRHITHHPSHVIIRWSNRNQHPPRQTNGRNTSRLHDLQKRLHSVVSQQPASWHWVCDMYNWHDKILEPYEEHAQPWLRLKVARRSSY